MNDLRRLNLSDQSFSDALSSWDPTSARLAVGVRGGFVAVDIHDPVPKVIGEPNVPSRTLAWSPDGQTVVVAYDERDLQCLYSAINGEKHWQIAIGETAIDQVEWSPDGRLIAFVGDAIVVCHAQTGAIAWQRSETRRRDSNSVVIVRRDEKMAVVERGDVHEELIYPTDVSFSPDSRFVAACWGTSFRVLESATGEVVAEGVHQASALRWGSWGKPLFVDGEVRLGGTISQIVDRWARTFTFSSDGHFIAAEGDKHCLWIEDEHGPRALVGHPRTIEAMAWSSRGMLATACRDRRVRGLSRIDAELEIIGVVDDSCRGLAFSPDGLGLVIHTGKSVFLWFSDP